MRLRVPVLLGALLACALASSLAQDASPSPGPDASAAPAPDVRISASISARPFLAAAARALKQEKNLQIAISAQRTSADCLDDLAAGKADIALLTKPLSGEDRAKYPESDLVATPVGMQVVALGVSADIWDAGVHVISQDNMRAIYEQKITNWKVLGGPDEKITLFTFEEGGGIWEILAEWLYGDNRKAPQPKVENVSNSQDARDALEFSQGAIAPIGASLVDGVRCRALSIDLPDLIATATPLQVALGRYPLVRPMTAVTVGRPSLAIRTVTEFLTSDEGQAMIKTTGAFGLDAFPKASDPSEAPTY
jgi:phosphate transport system substrate-binding protein